MKKFLLLSGALMLALPASASAATTINATLAPGSYAGPTPTFDFETSAPISGGTVRNSNIDGVAKRPTSSTGKYYAVGGVAENGTPAVLSLASFLQIGSLSFLWGTPDTYNFFEVLDGGGATIASYTGTVIQGLTGSTTGTALVTLNFDGSTINNVKALRFSSTQAAFEFDNVAVAAVPEPGVWAMMLLGFAAIGFSLRRRENTTQRVRFA